MNTPDDFSQYHAELLNGIYDCVDRIVLNAFFPLGQTGGGMRSWWRSLHRDDSQLDDKHLREMAGTFSRRLHAFCAKQGNQTSVDQHYVRLREELNRTFETIGL